MGEVLKKILNDWLMPFRTPSGRQSLLDHTEMPSAKRARDTASRLRTETPSLANAPIAQDARRLRPDTDVCA